MRVLHHAAVLCAIAAVSASMPSPTARANILIVTRGTLEAGTVAPVDNADVRVLHENLSIDIANFANRASTPVVSVAAEYSLQNDLDREQDLEIAFPFIGVFQPTARGFVKATEVLGDTEFGHQVAIDGQPVDAKIEALPIPIAPRTPYFSNLHVPATVREDDQRFLAAWKAWVAHDERLVQLLKEYSEHAVDHTAYSNADHEFRAAADQLLERQGHLAPFAREVDLLAARRMPDPRGA